MTEVLLVAEKCCHLKSICTFLPFSLCTDRLVSTSHHADTIFITRTDCYAVTSALIF